MLDKLIGEDELFIPATTVQFVSENRVMLETTKDVVKSVDWSPPRNVDTFRRR